MNKTNDESKELKENFKLLQTTFLQNDNALFFNVKHDINEEETYYNVVAVLVGILKKLNNNSDFNVLMYEDKKRICTNEIQKDSIKELGKLLKEKGQDAQETFEDISVVLTNGSLENISKVPYEIALSVQIYNGQIKIDFDLRGNKVSHRSFVILANYITASLEYAIARDFEEKIDECLYIGEEEQTKAIVAYNDSKCEFDDKINIVQRFYNNLNEDIKKRVALNYEGKKYTYKELDELSNSIAKKLKEDKINVGDTVGIFMDRSAEYIIAIFGILKVGATYLPMDTTYPLNRVKAIMEKSEAKGIIAFQNSELHKADINNKIYVYEELVSQPVAVYQTDYSAISSQNNAYMIFTSGSTGTPKGIAIRHMSVINLVEYMKGQMFTKAADRDLNVTVVAEFVFDVSVGQIFYTLLTGRTLHIVSKAAKKSMEEFTSLLNREKIDLSDITPVYFRFLVDYLEVHKKKVRLPRRIICVGEALPLVLVERFYKLEGTKDVVIVNGYGPTEACVYATYFELTSENVKRLDMMSIGKPLYNMQAYVLDEHLKLCPIGVEGELYLAGAGLAKGYVNEPEITKKAYIPNVFEKGAMMYKTGDLVKWDADGNINYIGRIDRQTKIRGFRIELGEIEKKIEKLDEVREAVVVVKEGDNGKFLVAFIENKDKLTLDTLKNHLRNEIPEYMMPSYFVLVEKLPRNLNGKTDIKQLPDYKLHAMKQEYSLEDERKDEIDIQVIEMCKEINEFPIINMQDDFFTVGGNSLTLYILLTQIYNKWGVEINTSQIYMKSTIRDISNIIKEKINTKDDKTEMTLSNQKEYWVSKLQGYLINSEVNLNKKRDTKGISEYPTTNMIYSIYSDKYIEDKKLQKAIACVVERHEMLRTTINKNKKRYALTVYPDVQNYYQYIKIDEELSDEVIKTYVKGFDIEQLPLFNLYLIEDRSGKQAILFNISHTIFDFMSFNIFINDLMASYNDVELRPLDITYKEYMVWQAKEKNVELEEFWRKYLRNRPRSIRFIEKKGTPLNYEKDTFGTVKFEIKEEVCDRLRELCNKHRFTEYIFILSALSLLLKNETGEKDIIIGSHMPGRNSSRINQLIGLFTTALPIRINMQRERNVVDFIDDNSKMFTEVLQYQETSIWDIMRYLDFEDFKKGALYDVFFNYEILYKNKISYDQRTISIHALDKTVEVYPIYFRALDMGDKIKFDVVYNETLYTKKYIEGLVGKFNECISTMLDNV